MPSAVPLAMGFDRRVVVCEQLAWYIMCSKVTKQLCFLACAIYPPHKVRASVSHGRCMLCAYACLSFLKVHQPLTNHRVRRNSHAHAFT